MRNPTQEKNIGNSKAHSEGKFQDDSSVTAWRALQPGRMGSEEWRCWGALFKREKETGRLPNVGGPGVC